jgi:hypothetical protein
MGKMRGNMQQIASVDAVLVQQNSVQCVPSGFLYLTYALNLRMKKGRPLSKPPPVIPNSPTIRYTEETR